MAKSFNWTRVNEDRRIQRNGTVNHREESPRWLERRADRILAEAERRATRTEEKTRARL